MPDYKVVVFTETAPDLALRMRITAHSADAAKNEAINRYATALAHAGGGMVALDAFGDVVERDRRGIVAEFLEESPN